MSSLDFLPTFAELSGAELPNDLVLDGTSFLPALEEGGELPREKPLMWIYYHIFTGDDYVPTVAMRDGDLKVRAVLSEGATGDQADEGNIDGEIDAEGDIPDVIVEQEPDINQFVFAEEEPSPINMSDVQKLLGYPQIARDAGIEGSVVVRVLVGKKGQYKKHKIINQVHPILAKAVEKEIGKLRFTPAIQGGKPIDFWVNIPFNFKLLDYRKKKKGQSAQSDEISIGNR